MNRSSIIELVLLSPVKFSPTLMFPFSSLSKDIKSDVTSNPFPRICGNERAIRPTKSPPRHVFRGTGIAFSFSNSISTKLRDFMIHYIVQHADEFVKEESHEAIRNKYKDLIENDIFLDMTLTYDYDNSHLNDLGKELMFNVT